MKQTIKIEKENMKIILSCMDLDLVLRIEKPSFLTDYNTVRKERL